MPDDLRKKVLDNATSDQVKNQLKKFTDECLDLGSFGAPIILVDVEG